MKKELLRKTLGDMTAVYTLDDKTGLVGLSLFADEHGAPSENARVYPLAEAKIIGDNYSGSYLGGESMRCSDTTLSLKYSRQLVCENERKTQITTYLKSEKKIELSHTLTHTDGGKYISVHTEIVNNSGADVTLEMLSSFALWGIGGSSLILHRMRSKWSQEGRLVSEPFEDLQLEDSWTNSHFKNIRFGQVGSMPVKGYFPFTAIEDSNGGVIRGVQMGCPSSWQMEVSRADECACLSGGLADREFGHWKKTLKNGERFSGPDAVLTVCRGGIDEVCHRLLTAQEDNLDVPAREEGLPIIFNEYCSTWGCPSQEKISKMLAVLAGRGIDYFVIDSGWFMDDAVLNTEGARWDMSMGDYIPSETLFPDGIKKTVELIKLRGFRPGIWFEPETVGRASKAYYNEEHLLKRDGLPLTTQNRRFWDMTDEWVKDYLYERVICFLKDNGFDYIKIDYNETIGIGCDDKDGLGEGLRKNMLGTVEFFKRIKEEIPNIAIENCASGGNRLEPCFMSLSSMASFSDAHECVEIPIIAADLQRLILPRQMQIWCVIRKSDSQKRIAYSVAAAFLGRMCFSGDVTELAKEQWELIETGIRIYKMAVPVIKKGKSKRFGPRIKSERHPEGYQAVMREYGDMTMFVIHTFKNPPKSIALPAGDAEILRVFSHNQSAVRLVCGVLAIENPEEFAGYVVLLKN